LSADDEKPPLDAALRHLAEQQRRSLTSHPTPQELAVYHAGELPPEAESRLLDHLAVCRDCSDLLLDLAGFADLKPPQGVPELTDEQVEQDWQALRSRMRAGEGREERTAEVVPIRPAGPPMKPARWTSLWLPVAASILAVLGFSFSLYQTVQVGALRQQLEAQSKPWSTTSVPLDDTTHRSGGEGTVQRMKSVDGAVLSLYHDEEVYPAYEAEIVGQGKLKAAPPLEDGLPVTLVIPRRSLGPGIHTIRLFGVKGDQRDEVGEYKIQVDEP